MTDERKVFIFSADPKVPLPRLFVVAVAVVCCGCLLWWFSLRRIGLATQHTTRRVGRGLSRGTNQRRRRSRAVVMWMVVEEEVGVVVIYK